MKLANQTSTSQKTEIKKKIFISIIAVINGTLYFNIAASGSGNLEKIFNIPHEVTKDLAYGLGAGASICNIMFYYKTLEGLTLWPKSGFAWSLTALAPIAALSFLTAGKEGAEFLGINSAVATTCGVALYALRIISMIDGSVKFPGRLQEIKSAWSDALSSKDYKEFLRIAVTLYTASAFSASATDSVYSATTKLGTWFGANPKDLVLAGFSYAFCVLGALDTFPFILYWTHRGIKQLTYGGKADTSGVNKDPTDSFTFVALAGTIPVILAVLGMVTAAEGMAFGKLGTFAIVLRLSSTLIYSVAAGVPGLSSLFRGIASSCKDSKVGERTPLLEEKKPDEEQQVETYQSHQFLSSSINEEKEETAKTSSGWFSFFRNTNNHKDHEETLDHSTSQKRRICCPCTIV